MKILLVEDDPSLAVMLVQTFQHHGAEVCCVDTAMAGRKWVEWADAVLCDGTFPLEPGFEPAHNWRVVASQALRCGKPFIVFSGDLMVCADARKAGFQAFEKGTTKIAQVWEALEACVKAKAAA